MNKLFFCIFCISVLHVAVYWHFTAQAELAGIQVLTLSSKLDLIMLSVVAKDNKNQR